MRLIIPPEIEELERIYMPYMDGCKLKNDAPPEAVEAFEKCKQWYLWALDQ